MAWNNKTKRWEIYMYVDDDEVSFDDYVPMIKHNTEFDLYLRWGKKKQNNYLESVTLKEFHAIELVADMWEPAVGGWWGHEITATANGLTGKGNGLVCKGNSAEVHFKSSVVNPPPRLLEYEIDLDGAKPNKKFHAAVDPGWGVKP